MVHLFDEKKGLSVVKRTCKVGFVPPCCRPASKSGFFAMSSPIVIPENAPFNAEQRAWLSEFLSKALSGQEVSVKSTGPATPVTVLWGSQTGNSEGVAKKLMKALKAGNYEPEIFDMGVYDKARLPEEKNLLIITSTYGDGEPPDNAADLHEYLMGDSVPSLEGVNFSILALGDSEYPDYCQCGIELDQRLEAFGATRMFKRIDCDVDYDDEFSEWKQGVVGAMGGMEVASTEPEMGDDEPFGKKNPFPSAVLNIYDLNGSNSERETYHIELSLEGSGLAYETGDALGVLSQNPAQIVDEMLPLLPFNIKDEVPLPNGGEASLREALITSYDIRSLNKKILTAWSERSGSPFLRALVEAGSREEIEEFCWGRELIDLINDHPADFSDGEEFVGVLKKLQPRLYSIASSPNAHPGEVHLTVAIVRYQSHGRDRGGVCSTYLSDRAGDVVAGVFVHNNKAFRLPDDLTKDVIMVGPGTGIAPFRAFLEERVVSKASGRNWLFFGNPHRATDYIYEDEIAGWVESGDLAKLDLAFSRDQAEKIYVQDKMLEAGADLWDWLQGGGYFYVCGDASRMAKDVDRALHSIAQTHGGLSEEEAVGYFKGLKKEKRYARDVY
ncbi:MAG: sulfite reductase (NADPH) flavoprotein alpha-component [Akkermansiaceae bacterium]|jgi:sulfite reductase (NADPH) flavoprotein alpha-component